MEEKWHALPVEAVLECHQTNAKTGLSSKEVKARQNIYGFNELTEKTRTSAFRLLLQQFQDFMVLVLLGATLISAFLGEYGDAITILAIIVINAVLGFIQEFRAEKSMAALKKLTAPTAMVIRDGREQKVSARELVPGDIVLLTAGDRLSADGRLTEAYNMEVEEAALTGESVPVRKVADRTFSPDVPLGDRKNLVFAGTSITRGRGRAVVVATGMHTEMGRIAGMIQAVEPEDTPLQRRLDHLGRWLVWGCLAVCLVVVITGVIRGESIFLMSMSGISLAVAAIPEGLPAIVTICLALGVQRMIKRNAIVRKLPAVETLGCTTVICSDKTGTLTQNEMTVRKIYDGQKLLTVTGRGYEPKGGFYLGEQEIDPRKDKALSMVLTAALLCNNSTLVHNGVAVGGLWRRLTGQEQSWSIQGDPTEGALVVAAAKAGLWRDRMDSEARRLDEIPFEPERRRMSVICQTPAGEKIAYVKGAPDTILELCTRSFADGQETVLSAAQRQQILATAEAMAGEALRVLAVAYRRLPDKWIDPLPEEVETDLVFAGLLGMIDPPREEVKKAMEICKLAGIKTVMITGDHKNTALAIARELNMLKEGDGVITGRDLDQMSDADLEAVVNKVTVYTRVSPGHKLRIVRALKKNGHIVAMTGDGVNDAPAVKEADIGIAMGRTGTDVTKEASAMILSDDNFASIVAAVEEGRGIYDNIRKFIRYLLASNIGEVLTMFLSTLAGLPLPLLPIQILWINLVTDGLPATALSVDPADRDVMLRSPRHPQESVFSRGLKYKILYRGLQIGLSTIFVFIVGLYVRGNLDVARTMAFTTLVMSQLIYVFDCRSESRSGFEIGLFSNKYLVVAVLCSTAMQLAVIYAGFLQPVFGTVPLSPADMGFVLLVSGWTLVTGVLRRMVSRRPKTAKSALFIG